MAISSTENAVLENLTGSYVSYDKGKSEKEDALGQEAFLTMLVAQLQNQDPLNPMDGTDFSAQLAQFSQLEQLINLNSAMETMAESYTHKSDSNAVDFIGKQVTGRVDTIEIDQGTVSGGGYSLTETADIKIVIRDSQGNTVRTLMPGQKGTGSHTISWDGKDNSGQTASDGTYKYTVLANTGYGFTEIPASVSGTVDGVTYQNGNPYLVVQGAMVAPDAVTHVAGQTADTSNTTAGGSTGDSILGYLSQTISADNPGILMENGQVSGGDLSFSLTAPEAVTVTVRNGYGEVVRTLQIDEQITVAGDNTVSWDGLTDAGDPVPDGLYYYDGVTASGNTVDTAITGDVSGIKHVNGIQYLVLDQTGRLILPSTITGVN